MDQANAIISGNKVAVFSKSYCPYCTKVIKLFKDVNADAYVVQLDEIDDGASLHAAVKKLSGISTVPAVFINGKFVGGCDDCHKLHQNGKLVPMIEG